MIAATLIVLAFMAAVMACAFVVQKAVNNTGWVDVFWTFGTGAAGAAMALWPADAAALPARRLLIAALVLAWSLRLGLHVALRVASSPEDARYADFRARWGDRYQRNLFALVMAQPPVSALICLSIGLAARAPGPLNARDAAGLLILVLAIAGEAVADRQLAAFKRAGHGRRAICDRGLWGWSRHPNYFFEWLGWLAYPVIGLDPARPLSWATLLAPLLMYLVLRFGTGVPPLEASMLRSRGEAFRRYQARVSAFFPLPPKARPSTEGAVP
jgi:steroid 5-alpha reductase family enzyme